MFEDVLAPGVGGSCPQSLGSLAFIPVTRQKYHGGRHWWRRAAHPLVARKQRERGRVQDQIHRLNTFPHDPLPELDASP